MLSGALKVPSHSLIGEIPRVLNDSTSYLAKGPVTLDGVRFTPRNGASIIVAPSFYKVFSSDAAATVGGIRLHDQTNFTLDTTPSASRADTARLVPAPPRRPRRARRVRRSPATST